MRTQEVLRELPVVAPAVQAAPLELASSVRTILLAEDNDDLREVMSRFLALQGFAVVAYSNAHLAPEAFCKGPSTPDILLTDIKMPGMTGLELARELTRIRLRVSVAIVSGSWISPELPMNFKIAAGNFAANLSVHSRSEHNRIALARSRKATRFREVVRGRLGNPFSKRQHRVGSLHAGEHGC